MGFSVYILIGFVFAGLFFAGAAYALYWSARHGQLDNLERDSRVIFDDEEPEGVVADRFPSPSSR